MCGRYQLQISADAIAASHRNTSWRPGHAARYYPRQQLRPTNHAPVVVAKRPASSPATRDVAAEIVIMKWGMSPAWSTGQSRPPLINARRETLLRLPTFRNALRRKHGSQRCAVPATGFYEWHKEPGPGKPVLTPYLVQMGKRPQQTEKEREDVDDVKYMAGLYEHEGENSGEKDCSFVIITTEASADFQWIHDRQPVFLSSQKDVDMWLDDGVTADEAVAQLKTESGLSWIRMTRDLSEAAKGKAMVQKGLDGFFGKKAATKKGSDVKPSEKTSPRKKKRISAESLRPAAGIRKERKSATGESSGKRKTLSSFLNHEKTSPRKKKRISEESLQLALDPRKEKNSSGRETSAKQETLSSFFKGS